MKSTFKLKAIRRIAGIIALAAAIGFALTACDDSSGDGGGDGNNETGTVVTNTTEWTDAISAIVEGGSGTAEEPKKYTISVKGGSEPIAIPETANFKDLTNIIVTIRGSGTLQRDKSGLLLNVRRGQTLIIDGQQLTLKGRPGNNATVIEAGVSASNTTTLVATLELRNGKIIDNTRDNWGGAGVHVCPDGKFIMSGGEISGNTQNGTSRGGGAVCIQYNGKFEMSGGIISGNTVIQKGGGVYVENSAAFTMTGGTILSNNAVLGGGVFVVINGIFKKTGGVIYGTGEGNNSNSASGKGNAVYFDRSPLSIRYRNTTLGNNADGNISTDDLANWTVD